MTEAPGGRSDATFGGEVRLGALRIDLSSGQVDGPGGRQQLDPKVTGVLAMLVRHAGSIVSREDLLARLWPNVVVTDDALSRCLYDLRRQLALAGGSDEYRTLIETLPKRGYRLKEPAAPPVAVAAAPVAAPTPARRRTLWVAGAVAALAIALVAVLLLRPFSRDSAVATRRSIAVLPFVDMSEAQDQQYFGDGLAEEILDRLNRSTDLRVIARTSSFWFRGKDADIPEIARKLDVTHVLEGSVRKSGDDLRVTAQLIAASDASHVWSQTFERRLDDVFAIQDEIAAGVAAALDSALVPRAAQAVATPSTAGHDSFMRGEFFYYRRAPGDIERAIAAYEAAVATDPGYARAWASLAGAYSFKVWDSGSASPAALEEQREAAERAVELDPRLAIAHIRLSQYYWETGQEDKGRQHAAIARQLDPGHPIVLSWAAVDAMERGDIPAAIAKLEQAVAREPLLPLYRTNYAVLLLADGQLDRALTEYRRVLELSPEGQVGPQTDIVRILVLQGRLAEAKAELESLPSGKRRDYGQALLIGMPGEKAAADAAFARLLEIGVVGATEEGISDAIQLAELQLWRGDPESAFATLQTKREAIEKADDNTQPAGVLWYLQYEVRVSPFLKPLHTDPRWAAFLADDP